MNRRSIFTLSAMMALGLALLPASTVAQQKTLKDQLIGAWTLVSNDTVGATGTKSQTFGASPKGTLILDASGRYASITMRPDRPNFKDTKNLRAGGTAEEFVAAGRATGANFGTWSVDEAGKTLIRQYEMAFIPNNDRQQTKAAVTLAGDQLTLTITPAAGGKNEVVYRRAK